MPREPSAACRALVADEEACELATYTCAGGRLTIGYGHTGPDVEPGRTITRERAEELLTEDLRGVAAGVARLVTVEITQNQFDALVSFAFNAGLGAFAESTLLRLVNLGKHEEVPAQFLRWTKSKGRELPGLVRRRAREVALYTGVTRLQK